MGERLRGKSFFLAWKFRENWRFLVRFLARVFFVLSDAATKRVYGKILSSRSFMGVAFIIRSIRRD